MMNEPMIESEAYKNMIAGILEQAAYDYMNALRADNRGRLRELEHFFLSEWGQALTNDNGQNIIERLRKEFIDEIF